MKDKTKLLFIAASFVLAMALVFTGGTALANVKSDGATLNANGGWSYPSDMGTCPADTTAGNRADCQAYVFPAYTDSAACSALPQFTSGTAEFASTCTDGAGTGISMAGYDRNATTCSDLGGTYEQACVGKWSFSGTYTGNDQCLRCHSTGSQYSSHADRWKERYLLTGHRNMLRKVSGAVNGTNLGGPGWESNHSDAALNFPTGVTGLGSTMYTGISSAYYIYGGWYRNIKEAQIKREAGTAPTPSQVIGTYSCGQCHTTGNSADTGGTNPQPDNGASSTTTWYYEGVQCDRCHNTTGAGAFDPTYSQTHHGTVAEDAEATELCYHCHEQTGPEPYQVLVSPSATDLQAYSNFTGHYRTNEFLNSPHARFEGTEGQVADSTRYESHFTFYSSNPGVNAGGCVTCHNVHVSGVDPDVVDLTNSLTETRNSCGVNCHPYQGDPTHHPITTIQHPGGAKTPLDQIATSDKGIQFACITCHMGPGTVHLFRINTDPTYSPFVSGQSLGATYEEEAGSTYPAVGMSLELVCGQCHNNSAKAATGVPQFATADLQGAAEAMHGGTATTPTPINTDPVPANYIGPAIGTAGGNGICTPDENGTCTHSPVYGAPGDVFTLTDASSAEGTGAVVYVDWDDGTPIAQTADGTGSTDRSTNGAIGDTFHHSYIWPGTYGVIHGVKDEWGFVQEEAFTIIVQTGTGKGTLVISADTTGGADWGLATNGQPLGLTYQVIDASVIPNVIVTSGTLVPSADPLANFKAIMLDAGTYSVKLMFPPTDLTLTTYHWCSGFNTSLTSSVTLSGQVVTVGGTTTVSGTACQ